MYKMPFNFFCFISIFIKIVLRLNSTIQGYSSSNKIIGKKNGNNMTKGNMEQGGPGLEGYICLLWIALHGGSGE